MKLKFALIALAMICTQSVLSQNKTIQGVVKDQTGFPLPGASVNVEGSKNSASTDIDGKYSLNNVKPNNKIVFSFIGTVSKTVSVGSQTTINVTLQESSETLSEVVVVAYGAQKRTTVTGAVATVTSKDIAAIPVTNAESALQGRAPGVTVVSSGSPGSSPTVLIRGLGTLNNSAPLYVIDGVITGNLSGLNANDIESMSVLKDAATAALYGSQGFNGVVVVTTKKGKRGPGQMNFSTYTGFQKITKRYDLLNTAQYLKFANDLGVTITRPASFLDNSTNWQDEIFQTGLIKDYSLNFSNGTETSSSRYSAEYLNQEGAVIGTGFERYSFRANNSQTLGKLTLGSNVGISFSKQDQQRTSGGRTLIEHAIKSAPYLPVYNADNLGGYQGPTTSVDGQDAENPVRVQNLGYQYNKSLSIIGNVYAELELYKGLKFRSQVALDYYNSNDRSFIPSFRDDNIPGVTTFGQVFSSSSRNLAQGQTIIFNNSLSYKTTIADKHNIEALVLSESNMAKYENIGAGSRNLITDAIDQLNSTTVTGLGTGSSKTNKLGFVARLNYNYDEKYIFEVSGRTDGSSRFGTNFRWGNFYAVSLGWNIAKEKFMEDSGVSVLKIRGSVGTTGNDKIGDYQYSGTLNSNYIYPIDGAAAAGTTIGSLSNPGLKWESKLGRNLGLDFGVLDNKLTGSIEYFNNISSDILFAVPLDPSLGSAGGTQVRNIASVQTQGTELNLGYNYVKGDLTWSANFNIGTTKNEVLRLAPGVDQVVAGDAFKQGGASISRLTVGDPAFYMYGLVSDGIYQNQAEVNAVFTANPTQQVVKPGDIRFKDLNGDGDITSADRTKIGNQSPKFTYGLNLSASFKRFDFNCFITGVEGNQIFNTTLYDLEGMTRLFNSGTAVLDRAIVVNNVVTNPSATIPRAQGAIQNVGVNDRFVEDGSYTRLRNITIGYTLPSKALGKYFSKLRVYASGQNLLTLTKYSGLDPEIGGSNFNAGVDRGGYPQPKTILMGLEVAF
ncbi:SusC/RagA family TonB-linked outer membrane protein [Flavobacterium faecale]|nr:TonB-dependent receptor [Flavobacterium faecale]